MPAANDTKRKLAPKTMPTTVRLLNPAYEKVKRIAKKEGRSINNWMVKTLMDKLDAIK
jgi:predicted HicB family RNase H-like nuclease